MKHLPSIVAVLAAAASLAVPIACRAASNATSPLALKIGALFPANADSRELGGPTQYVLGLDYTLSGPSSATSATSVYLDYLGGSRNSGTVHSTGVGVALRSQGTAYFGAGLGIYSTNVQFDGDEDDPRSSSSSGGAGGKVFAGFELGGGVSLEFDYHLLPASAGVNPSGAAIEVGIRL